MKNTSSKKANEFLKTNHQELRSIFARVKMLEELSQKVSAYLDTNSAKYCQVANLIGNKLILIAANGSVATQLRFQMNDLLRKFQQDPALRMIHQIECKVRPTIPMRHQIATKPASVALLSAQTSEIVREIAAGLDDPKLKEIMLRIASHTVSS